MQGRKASTASIMPKGMGRSIPSTARPSRKHIIWPTAARTAPTYQRACMPTMPSTTRTPATVDMARLTRTAGTT